MNKRNRKIKQHAFRYVNAVNMYSSLCNMVHLDDTNGLPETMDDVDCKNCLKIAWYTPPVDIHYAA